MRPRINVVAKNQGWLFEDLKGHFEDCRGPGHGDRWSCYATGTGDPTADAWIYIRTAEAAVSPDLARTIVQVHDVYDDYAPGSPRSEAILRAGAVCWTNPAQLDLAPYDPPPSIIRPIGALDEFFIMEDFFGVRVPKDGPFSVGWCGRPTFPNGDDVKGIGAMVEAIRLALPGRLCLFGSDLHHFSRHPRMPPSIQVEIREFANFGRPDPYDYQRLGCLLTASASRWAPVPYFEAMASGVPVISNCDAFFEDGVTGILARTPEEMATGIEHVRTHQEFWFAQRHAISEAVDDYTLEGWVHDNIMLAVVLAEGDNV